MRHKLFVFPTAIILAFSCVAYGCGDDDRNTEVVNTSTPTPAAPTSAGADATNQPAPTSTLPPQPTEQPPQPTEQPPQPTEQPPTSTPETTSPATPTPTSTAWLVPPESELPLPLPAECDPDTINTAGDDAKRRCVRAALETAWGEENLFGTTAAPDSNSRLAACVTDLWVDSFGIETAMKAALNEYISDDEFSVLTDEQSRLVITNLIDCIDIRQWMVSSIIESQIEDEGIAPDPEGAEEIVDCVINSLDDDDPELLNRMLAEMVYSSLTTDDLDNLDIDDLDEDVQDDFTLYMSAMFSCVLAYELSSSLTGDG